MSQIYLGLSDYLYWKYMTSKTSNLALKCEPSFFSVNFLDMDGIINQYTIWCFVGKKYPIKTFHGENQK